MTASSRLIVLVAAWLLVFPGFSCKPRSGVPAAEERIDSAAVRPPRKELVMDSSTVVAFLALRPDYRSVSDRLLAFYGKREFRCAWISSEGPADRSFNLANLLANALDEGVVLKSIDLVALQSMFDALPVDPAQGYEVDEETIRFELELTANYFLMADASAIGLPLAKRRSLEWYIPSFRQSPDSLAALLSDTSTAEVSLPHPEDSLYHRLQRALKLYRTLAAEQDWTPVGIPDAPVGTGEHAAQLPEIKKRLRLLGDLSDTSSTDDFDDSLHAAVRRFRMRHSLSAEGRIDSAFVATLNISPKMRVRQLLLNMERCRWLPKLPKGEFIIVNIPEYKLRYFKNNREDWSCPVIVGKSSTRTTVLSGRLNEIVFSPYWNVPKSILVKELLPEIKADPRKLSAYHLEIRTVGKHPHTVPASAIDWKRCVPENFPYELRQLPGPWNSLGQVKFLFPNNFGIYLHDTPSKGLFAQEQRMFSHGCVRVADPVRLAKEMLDDRYWTTSRIREAMSSRNERSVALRQRVPLLVVYFTSWVDESGSLHFTQDGYGHDTRLAEELFGAADQW